MSKMRAMDIVMMEHQEPQLVHRPDLRNTSDIILRRKLEAPNHIAFHTQRAADGDESGRYQDITMTEFSDTVDRIALSLIGAGLEVGQSCIVMASTSYEWALAEWAIWRAGGVVVPVYETSPKKIFDHIKNELGVKIAFISDSIVERLSLDENNYPDTLIISIEKIETFAADAVVEKNLEFLSARAQNRDDVASIVYTSGTTGEPRGTQILHRNFIDLILNVQAAWSDVLNDQGRTVIFLPLAHVLARGLQMICMWAGMRITYMSDPRKLIASLPELRPTFLVAVPRIFQKIIEATRQQAQDKHIGHLWVRAEQNARLWGELAEEADLNNTTVTALASWKQRIEHTIFDRLFYARIRKLLGGSMEFILSGAAPLSRDISLIFRGFGLPIMEGYGLTETTAPLAGNRPGRIRSGSVGELIPGTTVRIAQDGSILVKGVGVSPGYLDPRATAQSYQDGFFNTGDIGELRDGFLYITGRAKDMLVTAGGKTVAPAQWESLVEAHPLIEHAIMVGDNEPYLSALLILDKQNLCDNTKEVLAGIDLQQDLEVYMEVTHPSIIRELEKVVAHANSSVSRAEGVKIIRVLLADLNQDSGLITPTMKIKRGRALAYFRPVIESIYRDKD
ncbi:AMP-dependent synthetase/ligase [Arcanobacterium phocae]|uniref:AMP-dependent synthetase/ligase n=1 Tax=Arcanobacterium phocae TaxID=131112 RepID=UPI001C107C49|nr:AMP-dependent synthetase/ligase [Arcanobacterium phocae]